MRTVTSHVAATALAAMLATTTAVAQQSQSPQLSTQIQKQMQEMMERMQQMQQGQQGGQQPQGQTGQGMSQRDVRTFFQQMQQNVNQAVQSGNVSELRQWTQNSLAENARFFGMVEIYGATGSREFRMISADKQDLLRRQRVIMSVAPEILNAMQDFNMSIQVQSIQPIGRDTMLVQTRVTETGSIDFGGGRSQTSDAPQAGDQQGQQGQQPSPSAQGAGSGQQGMGVGGLRERWMQTQGRSPRAQSQLSFNSSSECWQVLQRHEMSGNIAIGMANCVTEVTF